MSWVWLSLIAAFCDSLIFFSFKKLKNVNNYFGAWLKFAFALPLLIIYMFFIEVPVIGSDFYYSFLIYCILIFFALSFIMKAMSVSEMSKSIPMLSFTPIFLLFVAFFVNKEMPSKYGLMGVLLVVVGTYILHLPKKKVSFFSPFRELFHNKGAMLILFVSFIFSLTASFGKLAIVNSNGNFFAVSSFIFVTLFYSPVAFKNFKKDIAEIRKQINYVILLGISAAVMIITVSVAFESGLAVYVTSIKRLSIIFSVFIGYFFLKERGFSQNLIGSLIMLFGAVLIIFFNN